MQRRKRLALSLALFATLAVLAEPAAAARIDAVRGRQYQVTKRHGPWMIMVASFNEPPPERRGEGMTPQQAADELVYELRVRGIPAYPFSQDDVVEQIPTVDRLGRERLRRFTAQQGSVCVLAGNYRGPSDRLARKTLEWIKNFRPRFLSDVEATNSEFHKLRSGGVFRSTPGQPGPLGGAHLTINPLLSPEEVSQRQRDPLLLKLNSGSEISLLRNPGKYTLIVASFYGRSTIKHEDLDVSGRLDEAGQAAWELAQALRSKEVVSGLPSKELAHAFASGELKSWVYHDHYRSIVTIGSFDSPQDPRLRQLAEIFGAKTRQHPQTGREVLVAEMLTLPPNPAPGVPPVRKWLFDPAPALMEVPALR